MRTTGTLDVGTAPQLQRALARALERGGQVVLDLSAVWFIDSTGLSVIANAVDTAGTTGAELRLGSPLPAQARRVIELTGLHSLLPAD